MKLICPGCGATLSIEALLMDGDARDAVQAALSLPNQLGGLVLRYIALFRPAKRALSWDRAAKILRELHEAMDSRQVEWKGNVHAAPLDLWQQAIESMLANRGGLELPLKSHGYLFSIVYSKAEKAVAHQERQHEERLRNRPKEGVDQGTTPIANNLPNDIPTQPPQHKSKRSAPPTGWKGVLDKKGSRDAN